MHPGMVIAVGFNMGCLKILNYAVRRHDAGIIHKKYRNHAEEDDAGVYSPYLK